MPPSTSTAASAPIERAHARELVERVRDERLPAPAGVDGHAQREVELVGDLGERADGGGRVDRHARARAGLADQVRGVGEVRRRLGVEGDRVRARLGELLDVALGTLDHQVHVEHRAGVVRGVRERRHDERADRDRRHEVPVHHVDVDHARSGLQHLLHLLAQPAEVGREDRRRDAHPAQQLASGRVIRPGASSRRSCCT